MLCQGITSHVESVLLHETVLQTNEVPKYDRTFESAAEPLKLDSTGERVAILASTRSERRCHNCGSYAHVISVRRSQSKRHIVA